MKKKIVIATITVLVMFSAAFFFINGDNETEKSIFENANSPKAERESIITKTVAKVAPAIVGINVIEVRQVNNPFFNPFFDDPFFQQFFGDQSYSQEVKGLGSGFLISSDGYILTNDHVAGNAKKVTVTLTDGRHFEAKVVGTDRVSDICLLKINEKNLPYLKLGKSDDIIIGEWSIALGNPFGLFDVNDQPTVTVGVISAINMNLEPVEGRFYLKMIQTDAAINGGNSGGPLVNALGDVIGINTIIYSTGSGKGSIGLGFAIPVNKVKRIVDELKRNGEIDRNFSTGLGVQDIDEKIASYYKLQNTRGVIVNKVVSGSPADKAGFKKGDVILALGEYKISNTNTLNGALQEYRSGQTAEFTVLRDGSNITLEMDLERNN
ncbi:MAG: trypsin-like peptidase domain-containing protein [Ignavibacteriales bacterium]|nr:MAG: PDZ domain-containing protein [Ignavibacteriaceae bacterium]MBW7872294.1 trypsin-like peptidase domain-containing protein [Ignavibacteria bacterium]MCZ2142577.1 trypsin-like peptidase domain-containing protein [Ignavibacteriales bacterium]OQY78138.1 MAG: 2-alkenal reductase [Ignavibacteriales bacterium UTCHB3]MBV6445559.1 putative serine protease HtrA [Ignavibacteriaceae bacterium]